MQPAPPPEHESILISAKGARMVYLYAAVGVLQFASV